MWFPQTLPLLSLDLSADASELVRTMPARLSKEEKSDRRKILEHLSISETQAQVYEANKSESQAKCLLVTTGIAFALSPMQKHKSRKRQVIPSPKPQSVSPLVRQLHTSCFKAEQEAQFLREKLLQIKQSLPLKELRSIKAKIFLRTYGANYLKTLMQELGYGKLKKSLQIWRNNVRLIKEAEKKQEFCRMKGAAILKHIIRCNEARRLISSINTWRKVTDHIRTQITQQILSKNAIIIQKYIRGMQHRKIAINIRSLNRARELSVAATSMQRCYRSHKSNKLRHFLKLNSAVKLIQRNWRICNRYYCFKIALQDIRQKAAATLLIQCRYRQRQSRLMLKRLKHSFKVRKCVQIQGFFRILLAKAIVKSRLLVREQHESATRIQASIRVYLAKRCLSDRRRQLEIYQIKLEQSVFLVQRVFRGHKGRKQHKLKLLVREEETRKSNERFITLQAHVRRRLAQRLCHKLRKQQFEEFCSKAREWMEKKDPEGRFFFQNLLTNATSQTPPKLGYTTFEQKLQLFDGRLVDDPVLVEEQERLENMKQCEECEDIVAARSCVECEMVYCSPCFSRLHAKDKWKLHVYEWIQDGAEEETPEWIELFDQDSQMPYWWNTQTGESVWYHPHMPQEVIETPQVEWEQYVDESTQYPYWYNTYTGETTWEDPYNYNVWEEHWDEASGLPYWYNSVSGESQWQPP